MSNTTHANLVIDAVRLLRENFLDPKSVYMDELHDFLAESDVPYQVCGTAIDIFLSGESWNR